MCVHGHDLKEVQLLREGHGESQAGETRGRERGRQASRPFFFVDAAHVFVLFVWAQGATWGVGIIFSYLVLFLIFYVQTYRSKPSPARHKQE